MTLKTYWTGWFIILLNLFILPIAYGEATVKHQGTTGSIPAVGPKDLNVGHPQGGKISDRFSNILLRTQDNKPVHFYDDLVKDKTVIVNFIYTTCQRSCIPTTAKLALVHKYLGKRVGRDILMLSISLDPTIDTPKVLSDYIARFGHFPGWYFLTGNYEEIERLRIKMGIYDLDPRIDADKTQHAGIITFGNDRTNRWSALPALMNPRGIARTVRRITQDQ